MNDMSQVIVPKSDQVNSDDLISGPITITINDVQIRGGQEQPVSIYFEGSDKAFRPCKSMSRVLVNAWGPDAKVYIGRSLTLYRDPTVKWAGMEVGGIRISHMSHLEGTMTMALTATKGSRKPFVVQPLAAHAPDTNRAKAQAWVANILPKIEDAADAAALTAIIDKTQAPVEKLKREHPDLADQVSSAIARASIALDSGEANEPDMITDDLIASVEAE